MEYKREIKSWTIAFSVSIVKLTKELENKGIPFAIINQILRSGNSIGANVHEGKSSSSEKELIRYLSISLKSANETEYWLKVIQDAYAIESITIKECEKELTELQKVLATIILKLKNKHKAIKN
ncbi:MAG: four helix bundle protein [Bacteroidetes bacterium]|nr:four helix bundle protein [Bacteroidota bacterium]